MTKKRVAAESPEPKRSKSAAKYDEKILTAMVYYNYKVGGDSVKVDKIEKECGVGQRNKNFRTAFNDLVAMGHILKSNDGYQLSERGEALAATYDPTGAMQPPTTSQAFVDRLKSRLKDKGGDILDLYLKYGTMTRKQAAALLGCNDRSHKFSYGMQSLRIEKNEYLEIDGANSTKGHQVLVLTDRAFFNLQEYIQYKDKLKYKSLPVLPEMVEKVEEKTSTKEGGTKAKKEQEEKAGGDRPSSKKDGEEESTVTLPAPFELDT